MAFEFVVPEWDFELQMSCFVLAKPINGPARLSNFDLIVEEAPQLNIGEVLAYAEWISVDAYVREVNMPEMEVGEPIPGAQIARIVRSRNDDFPVGTLVIGYFGWRDLTVYKPSTHGHQNYMTMCHMPDMKGLPVQYALGVMGMPGNTAYWGIVDGCQPESGATLVVSSAGGSVGGVACQIGRIMGCKVIAFVGSEAKKKWVEKTNKVEHVINYKTLEDLGAAFKDDMFPDGIDYLFDLVGGNFLLQAMKQMNHHGRVVQVGNLSNLRRPLKPDQDIVEPFDWEVVRDRELVIQGFNPKLCIDKGYEGIYKIRDWILAKRLKVAETVTIGFEKTPQVFLDMLNGKNLGKQLVRCRFFKPNEMKSTFPQAPPLEQTRINKYTRAGRKIEFNSDNLGAASTAVNQKKSLYTKSQGLSQNKSLGEAKTLDKNKSQVSRKSFDQNKITGTTKTVDQNLEKTKTLDQNLGKTKTLDHNKIAITSKILDHNRIPVGSKILDHNKVPGGSHILEDKKGPRPSKTLDHHPLGKEKPHKAGKTDQHWGGLASRFRKGELN